MEVWFVAEHVVDTPAVRVGAEIAEREYER